MCLVFALIHNSQVRPSEHSDKFDHSAHRTHLFVSLKFHVSENCISSRIFVWKKGAKEPELTTKNVSESEEIKTFKFRKVQN